MSEHKVGDVVDHCAVREMPVGTVLIATGELVVGSGDWAGSVVITRTDAEDKPWSWWRVPRTCVISYEGIHVGLWRIVHLPEPVVPKVGDIIDTEEQAELLPIGSVIWEIEGAAEDPDDESEHDGQRPAVKVADGRWLFAELGDDPTGDICGDHIVVDLPHRVIHIPASADAGTGSTAA